MNHQPIADWDDAYANSPHIAGSGRWPAAWSEPARDYRETLAAQGRARLDLVYGDLPRNRFDLFLPEGAAKGLVVLIHGGYWLRYDKSLWSHLARGAVESGLAVAMPSYTLCPEIRIAGIVAEIGAAIEQATAMIDGPVHLAGHSAGGHLAARMVCATSPLPAGILGRLGNVVPISGLHDLRPLMRTSMNATLLIDKAEAAAQSPALLEPLPDARVICWVGEGERPEFLRQNALLANIWTGLGAAASAVVEPDRHHFDIVEGLCDPAHPLTRTLLTGRAFNA